MVQKKALGNEKNLTRANLNVRTTPHFNRWTGEKTKRCMLPPFFHLLFINLTEKYSIMHSTMQNSIMHSTMQNSIMHSTMQKPCLKLLFHFLHSALHLEYTYTPLCKERKKERKSLFIKKGRFLKLSPKSMQKNHQKKQFIFGDFCNLNIVIKKIQSLINTDTFGRISCGKSIYSSIYILPINDTLREVFDLHLWKWGEYHTQQK